MQDKLLEQMFDISLWEKLIDKAESKGIDKTILRRMSEPQNRIKLLDMIVSGQLEPDVPHEAKIPKDTPGDFRTVVVSESEYRVIYSLINDSLFILFPHMVHPSCKSYQTGESCAKTVQQLSRKMVAFEQRYPSRKAIGKRYDFHAYFDGVALSAINNLIDVMEMELGFAEGTEPVCNFMRKVFASDLIFDEDGNLIHRYMGIRQGNALASFYADAILYELDDFMTRKYDCYYRYSDDLIVITDKVDELTDDIQNIICKYGVSLNPRKIATVYKDEWIKFLGFSLKNDTITLSRNRVKNFQKEIEKRTIKHRNISAKQAKQNVINYLYKGDYNWATSALGTINVKHDIDELNKFIMDCIRACETGKKKIGGLGYVNDREDYTILRGIGKNVKANRQKTQKIIDDYLTVGCLANDMKISKCVFEAAVRGI